MMQAAFPKLLILTLMIGAQGAATKPAATKPAAGAAWPKLDGAKMVELGKAVEELRRANAPELLSHAAEKIVDFEKGAVPLLYEVLSRQKPLPPDEISEEAQKIIMVLDMLVTKDDGPRIGADAQHRHALIRRFALRKAAEFGFAEALAAARKNMKDPDEDVRFEAALVCASQGELDGFDILLKACRDRWPQLGARIRRATEHKRSPEATQKCLPGLHAKEWQDICGSLRLLSGWGVKDCAREVGAHLSASDHRIKEDAINALRGIIDNAPPIEKLSAFDLAEMASAWSKRI